MTQFSRCYISINCLRNLKSYEFHLSTRYCQVSSIDALTSCVISPKFVCGGGTRESERIMTMPIHNCDIPSWQTIEEKGFIWSHKCQEHEPESELRSCMLLVYASRNLPLTYTVLIVLIWFSYLFPMPSLFLWLIICISLL